METERVGLFSEAHRLIHSEAYLFDVDCITTPWNKFFYNHWIEVYGKNPWSLFSMDDDWELMEYLNKPSLEHYSIYNVRGKVNLELEFDISYKKNGEKRIHSSTMKEYGDSVSKRNKLVKNNRKVRPNRNPTRDIIRSLAESDQFSDLVNGILSISEWKRKDYGDVSYQMECLENLSSKLNCPFFFVEYNFIDEISKIEPKNNLAEQRMIECSYNSNEKKEYEYV